MTTLRTLAKSLHRCMTEVTTYMPASTMQDATYLNKPLASLNDTPYPECLREDIAQHASGHDLIAMRLCLLKAMELQDAIRACVAANTAAWTPPFYVSLVDKQRVKIVYALVDDKPYTSLGLTSTAFADALHTLALALRMGTTGPSRRWVLDGWPDRTLFAADAASACLLGTALFFPQSFVDVWEGREPARATMEVTPAEDLSRSIATRRQALDFLQDTNP